MFRKEVLVGILAKSADVIRLPLNGFGGSAGLTRSQ